MAPPTDYGSCAANELAELANLILHVAKALRAHKNGNHYMVDTRHGNELTYPHTDKRAILVQCHNASIAAALLTAIREFCDDAIERVTIRPLRIKCAAGKMTDATEIEIALTELPKAA